MERGEASAPARANPGSANQNGLGLSLDHRHDEPVSHVVAATPDPYGRIVGGHEHQGAGGHADESVVEGLPRIWDSSFPPGSPLGAGWFSIAWLTAFVALFAAGTVLIVRSRDRTELRQ